MINDIKGLIKERRLPYSWTIRYHEKMYKHKCDAAIANILNTPSQSCLGNSNNEMHLQVCKKDINMALLALKSLLRFNNNFSVVIHDDNTLSESDYSLIKEHITNVKFLTVEMAEEISKKKPEIWRLRQEFHKRFDFESKFNSRIQSRINKIFDMHPYSDANNILYLDSDTIFKANPTFLQSWLDNPLSVPFHTMPSMPNVLTSPKGMKDAFPDMEIITNFNSGFFGFRKEVVTYEFVVSILNKLLDHREVKIYGDESVWRIIYGHISREVLPFADYPLFEDKKGYNMIPSPKDAKYMHFICKHRYGYYAKEADKIIQELGMK